jgi:hypothetical protein
MLILFSCKKIKISSVNKIKTGNKEFVNNKIVLKGELIDENKSGISQYGHCWSKNIDPTLLNSDFSSFKDFEKGKLFESILSNIEINKTYYYRTYSISKTDTTYFEIKTFTVNVNDLPNSKISISNSSVINDHEISVFSEIVNLSQINIKTFGVCWSIDNTTPNLNDSHSSFLNQQIYSFTDTISNLIAGQQYHFRSYVKLDENVVLYSNLVNLTIEQLQVETVNYAINNNIAILKGSINQLGVGQISDHGFCWSTTTSNPNYNCEKIQLGLTSSLGDFFGNLNLISGSTYYFKAFAIINNEISYGTVKTINF